MNETTTDARVETEAGVRTFRGESIEALLPQIRAELGPEAVILCQREGLIGGVGGFFQKRCVEVEARAGGPGIDLYDEEPMSVPEDDAVAPLIRNDAATREGLATPAVQELVEQAEPFAEMLGGATETAEPVELEPEPVREQRPTPRRAVTMREGMARTGFGDDLAGEISEAVVANVMPFATPARMRTLMRNELALRLPVAPAVSPGPRTIAMVGPAGAGKSAAIAAIAAAYENAGMTVAVLQLGDSKKATAETSDLTLIDTPALWSGSEDLRKIARKLSALAPDEIHLVMRAGTAAGACAELAEGLAELKPNRILLSGAAETSHLGGVLDAAIRTGIPLGYVAESAAEIAPADPRALAERIVP